MKEKTHHPQRSRHFRSARQGVASIDSCILTLGLTALLMVVTAGCGADEVEDDGCDDTCELAQAPFVGEITITEGFVGYSIFESDFSFPDCGAPCEFDSIDFQVASVGAELDRDGIRALILDNNVEWTTHTVEGAYGVTADGPIVVCWPSRWEQPSTWPSIESMPLCASFTIATGEVWTVHAYAIFGLIGRLIVFDPAREPWPSEAFRPPRDDE